jgi:cyclopropane-fatty-acyl-phospholipid synthase
MNPIEWAERGWIPEAALRWGIRRRLKNTLARETGRGIEDRLRFKAAVIQAMDASPVALATDAANRQHYEVPTAFYRYLLGPAMKYSGCVWPEGVESLKRAEQEALRLTAERADIRDGHKVLELGCGWGALSLFLAEEFPGCRIQAVSNSRTQREYIEEQCSERGIENLTVTTADMNEFRAEAESVDRIVSVEMFEHIRNWRELLRRAAGFLKSDGKLFLHIFCHRDTAYFYREDDWMGQYFFTGGMMPSRDLLLSFQDHFRIEDQWAWNGLHYARTLRAWQENMARNRLMLTPILDRVYGEKNRTVWWMRWRLFLLACEELFAYHRGEEWFVAHYRLGKRR